GRVDIVVIDIVSLDGPVAQRGREAPADLLRLDESQRDATALFEATQERFAVTIRPQHQFFGALDERIAFIEIVPQFADRERLVIVSAQFELGVIIVPLAMVLVIEVEAEFAANDEPDEVAEN